MALRRQRMNFDGGTCGSAWTQMVSNEVLIGMLTAVCEEVLYFLRIQQANDTCPAPGSSSSNSTS